jgi:hypothetical protein
LADDEFSKHPSVAVSASASTPTRAVATTDIPNTESAGADHSPDSDGIQPFPDFDAEAGDESPASNVHGKK